ncbi:MAG: hypothetical protein R3F34_19840, partial [Planctomycetota bacterium]
GAAFVFALPGPVVPVAAGPACGRRPGSLLVYPLQRSALLNAAVFTVVNVTNTNRAGVGETDVHFQYVNVTTSGSPFLFAKCTIEDRVETLTPADTLSVLTSCHNGALLGEGYLVVTARDPEVVDVPWSFDHLIGSEYVVSAAGGMYALNAIPFCSPAPEFGATDLDGDGKRDFDGMEYELIADELYVDSFLGSVGGDIVLISFLGGEYLNEVDFVIYNDDEFQLSATWSFSCWTRTPLAQISGYFTQQGLATTSNDPGELDITCDGVQDLDTGWAIVRGKRALAITSDDVEDPAILGALANDDLQQWMNARLLWESSAKQTGAQFPN